MEWIFSWVSESLDTLIQVLLIIVVSYLGLKAKNWATKEDIGKITTIVEQVKTLFNLKFHTDSNLWNEQRDALANYYEEFNQFWSTMETLSVNMGLKYQLGGYDKHVHMAELINERASFRRAYYRVMLFVDDRDIVTTVNEMEQIITNNFLDVIKGFATLDFKKGIKNVHFEALKPPKFKETSNKIHENLLPKYAEQTKRLLSDIKK